MRLGLIGVPYNSAGQPGGEARAPAALRAAGLVTALGQAIDVFDYGDAQLKPPNPERDPVTGIINPGGLAEMVVAVDALVRRAIADGRLPLVIGGECPLLLGCLTAARAVFGRVGLLFVDGHEDAWPPDASTTGEAADMELGFILGTPAPRGVVGLDPLPPLVQPGDVAILGPRDRDELRAAGIRSVEHEVRFYDDVTLRCHGVGATARAETAQLHDTARRWWFHLDLDVLATEALAAVRYPQSGGLAWTDLAALAHSALATPGLVGWNVTIYNPDLDPDGTGARQIVAFLAAQVQHLIQPQPPAS